MEGIFSVSVSNSNIHFPLMTANGKKLQIWTIGNVLFKTKWKVSIYQYLSTAADESADWFPLNFGS